MSIHAETAPDWERIDRELTVPFAVEDIDFRPQGTLGADGKGRVVGYIDARAVQERLDRAVGREHWSFTWEAILMDKHIRVVKGILIIHGVRKEDVGDSVDQATEPTKAAVSDAQKRVAVQWGIGRELYGMRLPRIKGEPSRDPNKPNNWTIPDTSYQELERYLAQHGTPRAQEAAPQEQPARPQLVRQPESQREQNSVQQFVDPDTNLSLATQHRFEYLAEINRFGKSQNPPWRGKTTPHPTRLLRLQRR